MNDVLATLTHQDLSDELDRVERAIRHSITDNRWTDGAGRRQITISRDLLALTKREHAVVQELKRRRPLAALPPAAAA